VKPTAEFQRQYEALRNGVGLRHLENWTLIELTGDDRASFLHNFCTNDIKGLKSGSGCEAFVTNGQGKMLGFVFVFCCESSLELLTVPGQAEVLVSHLDRYLIREDVEIHDRSSQQAKLILAGSRAIALLSKHGIKAPDEPMSHVSGELNGTQVVLRRVPWTGQECFVLGCDVNDVSPVTESLLVTNKSEADQPQVILCDSDAVEACRIESGMPKYAVDITDANLPQEINRNDQAISFTKGCYLGQETVARIDALGHVNRLLVGLKVEGPMIPEPGTDLTVGDKIVGKITSAAFSPALQTPLALALVRREHTMAATKISTASSSAEVCAFPIC